MIACAASFLSLAGAGAIAFATHARPTHAQGTRRPVTTAQHHPRLPSPRGRTARGLGGAAANATSSLVARLSISQLAGQRIVYAYAGLTPPSSLLARIRAGEAAGVVFFSANISSRAQIHDVVDELQAANAAGPVHVPLLMLVDQEGGLVRRLPGGPVLSERQIGERPNGLTLAAEAGREAAENLASASFNVNLAPVLDVYRQPGDFIDEYQRSYGSDTHTVSPLGAAFVSAQQRAGVAATAKHFPGLGAAERGQDTDQRPVTLDVPLSQIRSVDEAPYRTAIAAGVRLVMLSWAVYPALDPRLPAGLSSAVIQGELRGRLGFRGVTITDGIGARTLAPYATLPERGVLAARAGADLLLCSAPNPSEDTPAEGVSVLHGVATSLAAGRLDVVAARQAAQRILTLRSDPWRR
jgi:beta-N-acetylhexosaminidase